MHIPVPLLVSRCRICLPFPQASSVRPWPSLLHSGNRRMASRPSCHDGLSPAYSPLSQFYGRPERHSPVAYLPSSSMNSFLVSVPSQSETRIFLFPVFLYFIITGIIFYHP